MKWEYDVGWISGTWKAEEISALLTRKGAKGWELVTVIHSESSKQLVFFFKRALSD